MDLFHKIIDLIDKNSSTIPEGDYLELCDTIKKLRDKVKPPSFLLNQNDPLWETDGPPVYEPTLPSDPDTAAQREREQIRHRWRELDEEVMYPGLNQFLQDLHEEWSDPVEPGAYYPPPRQAMQDVVAMEVD
jgi:hypothetical protein